ncbi:uncharacterized protein LOC118939564 [Oncorhynchus mykiss]|uniref:uncharacterized protein LOC118939564 n=1 Tax=Oncorhynchus mykiss TaxID=8022 RepID=UPI001878C2C5|nr:uncharacterized protein LOC118939564 [Oncorhynchus mykiss]
MKDSTQTLCWLQSAALRLHLLLVLWPTSGTNTSEWRQLLVLFSAPKHDLCPQYWLFTSLKHYLCPQCWLFTSLKHYLCPQYWLFTSLKHYLCPQYWLFTSLKHYLCPQCWLFTSLKHYLCPQYWLFTSLKHYLCPQYWLFTSLKHYLCPQYWLLIIHQPISRTELQCKIRNNLHAGPGKLYPGPTSKTHSTSLLLTDATEQQQ